MSHKSKHGKNHPPANPKNDSTEEKSTKRHVYVEPGVQIDVVQDLKDQHETERGEDTATHKKQIFWTKVGAALVLVYAVLTFLMYLANKKAAEAADSAATTAKEALVRGQRPWVGPEKGPDVALSEGNPGIQSIISVSIKNYGPSPALHLSYYLEPTAIGNSTDRVEERSKFSCQMAEIPALTADKVQGGSFGVVMFPNGISTIFDKRNWNPEKGLNQNLAIVGCIAYVDQFHDTSIHSPIHHTRFCFQSFEPINKLIAPKQPVRPPLFGCNFAQSAD